MPIGAYMCDLTKQITYNNNYVNDQQIVSNRYRRQTQLAQVLGYLSGNSDSGSGTGGAGGGAGDGTGLA